MSGSPLHSALRRYQAEDLVRRRRSDEQRRFAAPQRAARIDANPHQVEAVIFALGRLREGGCILADEVGLGKTIEAGLVMAQLMAEGARRVLLLAPKSLLGQWRQELFDTFGVEAREGQARPGGLDGEGVFLVGREAAGSERGREAIISSGPFDLIIIDEAHELFSGLYRRFDKVGQYQEDSDHARTAGRVYEAVSPSGTPVLLLTATPIQNNLAELWGLVKYVDPLGTLLGDLPTFRSVFCSADDRMLMPGQEQELRDRLRSVMQRTLRRQAQPFLERPFVNRQARLFDYAMSAAERALYEDVTRYLLEANLQAFRGNHRHLLLLGFHRRLASSTRALATSLESVARRLRAMLSSGPEQPSGLGELLDEFEEDAPTDDADMRTEKERAFDAEAARVELQRVEGFIRRARDLGEDAKFRALMRALKFVQERAAAGQGAAKLVIFTESRVTQEYLRERLNQSAIVSDQEITIFNGTNDSPRAREALERWRSEVPQNEGTRPSLDIATRQALVHEFKTRSRVFISTEAGAKGLNLQFCNVVVNYDLPWNPQRIEQRIGRCHRYGQQHEVTVINFLASDNEAQALTFDILSRKLDLFGTVLDASDHVLHKGKDAAGSTLVSTVGTEFETELRKIYERARTLDEVTAELRALRDRVEEERRRFEETHRRTAGLIEEHFDEAVQRTLRLRKLEIPPALAELDLALKDVVEQYLRARRIRYQVVPFERAELLKVEPSPHLPPDLREGLEAVIGPSKERRSLNLGHPLVIEAVADARAGSNAFFARADASPELRMHAGKRCRLRVMKLAFDGFESEELLMPVAVFEDGAVLGTERAAQLLELEFGDVKPFVAQIADDALDDAVEEELFAMQAAVDRAEEARFVRASQQAEKYIEDRLSVLKSKRAALAARGEQEEQRLASAVGSEARTEIERALFRISTEVDEIQGAIDGLERRDDPTYRSYRDHIQRRRYSPPRVEKLLDVDLILE